MELKFQRRSEYGNRVWYSKTTDPSFSIIQDPDDNLYYIRIWENDQWRYPTWEASGFRNGFKRIEDVIHRIHQFDWETATSRHIDTSAEMASKHKYDFESAMNLLGFEKSADSFYSNDVYEYHNDHLDVRVMYYSEELVVDYWVDGKRLKSYEKPLDTADIAKTVRNIEKMVKKHVGEIVSSFLLTSVSSRRFVITAASNSRDLSQSLVRTKSSNIWAYKLDLKSTKSKTGDLLIQFKGKNGGPDDIYIYYDVPVMVYRKLVGSQSKGHFFWVNIRDRYTYAKLTGDKRTKLKNGV